MADNKLALHIKQMYSTDQLLNNGCYVFGCYALVCCKVLSYQ